MAAIHYALVNIAEMGNNIVSLPQLYGATYTLLAHILPKQGIEGRFSETDHPDAVEKLIDKNTRAVYCESVGNPAGNVADIEGLARVAHKHGVPLIVDNTVATPILLRPFEYGADVIVHSMTKFMGGHGTTLGGMIVDGGKFPWRDHPERFYMLNKPEIAYHGVVYTERFGAAAYVARCRTVAQRNTGSTLSPFNAFLLLQGIETMALRVERHVENARKVAEFLRNHKRVAWVNYAGFPDSPLYPMAQRYLGPRACSLLTFGVKGGFEQGVKCFDALVLFKRMVNMGDAKSLSCHPASTTHRQLTPEEQAKAGVTPEMIRLSVGIEHIDDIIADLAQALDKATP
jgi:O-acetylhomoserine (thiol)-lyase